MQLFYQSSSSLTSKLFIVQSPHLPSDDSSKPIEVDLRAEQWRMNRPVVFDWPERMTYYASLIIKVFNFALLDTLGHMCIQ